MSFSKGCGCLLVAVGSVAMLFAVVFAWALCVADDDAGKKNKAEWEVYNAWAKQLDTLEDSVMVDSLMASHPQPIIRQGGFASAFGIVFGLGVIVIAAFPLGIGCILLVRHAQKKRKETLEQEELLNRKIE